MEKSDIKSLRKRYLIWLYKTTKEALDKVERKFTQIDIDRFLLKELRRRDTKKVAAPFIKDFESYIRNKEKNGIALKCENGAFKPEYLFLVIKLKAIEKAVIKEAGKNGLREIKAAYEQEMIKRILEERQQKV
ncbi:MAG: hypothetical protein KKC84_07895 [Candidatus Omnitrophica bacterium]|nr:hypothetical protein [Candidatus Omnitrophota bacterium]